MDIGFSKAQLGQALTKVGISASAIEGVSVMVPPPNLDHHKRAAVVSDHGKAGDDDAPQKKRARVSSEEQWNTMLERLRMFREQFGHANVPKRYPADPQL